jgi:DNA helicase HerA-like ATPase
MMEKGKLIIVVGFTGTGKTTLVKKLIKKVKNPVIFDVNNEYGKPQYYGNILPPIEDWVKHVNENVRNSVVVVDEATIFFSKSGVSNVLKETLVRKRHTGNTYILNFHYLSSVPNDILAFCNYFILFKTQERYDLVHKKYQYESDIFDAYLSVEKDSNKHSYRFIKRI